LLFGWQRPAWGTLGFSSANHSATLVEGWLQVKSFHVAVDERRAEIVFGTHRFSGPIFERSASLFRFVHDQEPYSERPHRELAVFRDGDGTGYLTHGNGIPILRWSTQAPVDVFFYSTRMLRQWDFDVVHVTYSGHRGVFSPFTGICDIAIDHPFFLDKHGHLIEHKARSTLAHELSHRKFNELDDWTRGQMINAFLRDPQLWLGIRSEFAKNWSTALPLSSGVTNTVDEAVAIVDELLAKTCSYAYRESRAIGLIQFIHEKVFATLPLFHTFFNEVIAEANSSFHSETLLPVF